MKKLAAVFSAVSVFTASNALRTYMPADKLAHYLSDSYYAITSYILSNYNTFTAIKALSRLPYTQAYMPSYSVSSIIFTVQSESELSESEFQPILTLEQVYTKKRFLYVIKDSNTILTKKITLDKGSYPESAIKEKHCFIITAQMNPHKIQRILRIAFPYPMFSVNVQYNYNFCCIKNTM